MFKEKYESVCPGEMELGSHLGNTELLLFCSAENFIYSNKSWAAGQKFSGVHWSCNQEMFRTETLNFCLSFKKAEISVINSIEKDIRG